MNHTQEPWKDEKCVERFWSKVDVKSADECWNWLRGTSGFGYGNFHFGKLSIRAHRFSYQLLHGALRSHDCVCHTCDNPKCVNPAHLWIGTRAENNADKEAKLRGVHPTQGSGEKNSFANLSTPEVVSAKVMHRKGMPQARIATYLGVSNATICMIVNNERRSEETEQRVSACVNACKGIETTVLEEHALGVIGAEHSRQHKELITALKLCAAICSGESLTKSQLVAALESAQKILNEVTA